MTSEAPTMTPDAARAALDSTDLSKIDDAIGDVTAAARRAEAEAQKADAAALDPRATSAEVTKRRKVADDARFAARRADAALETLRAHRATTAEAQAEEAARARYDRAAKAYVAVLDTFEAEWDATVDKLLGMARDYEKAMGDLKRAKRDDYEGVVDPRGMPTFRALNDLSVSKIGGTPAVRTASNVLQFYG